MKKTNHNRYDLKRDENFAQTSINFLKREKRVRAVIVSAVALTVGVLLVLGAFRLLSGDMAGRVPSVLIGLVVVRFILRTVRALLSALFLIVLILILSGILQ